jgi:hypothetical protein
MSTSSFPGLLLAILLSGMHHALKRHSLDLLKVHLYVYQSQPATDLR